MRQLVIRLAIVSAGFLAVPRVAQAAEIIVCEDRNFRGKCVTLKFGVMDLSQWGITNRISSFQIRSGTWRMCTGRLLSGTCTNFTRSMGNLNGTPFQDAISSMRPMLLSGGGSGSNGVAVFSEARFGGRGSVVTSNIADMRRVGMDDAISSIRVLGGRWQFCMDPNYRNCKLITGDIQDLQAIGLTNRISSIRAALPGETGFGEGNGGSQGGNGGGFGGGNGGSQGGNGGSQGGNGGSQGGNGGSQGGNGGSQGGNGPGFGGGNGPGFGGGNGSAAAPVILYDSWGYRGATLLVRGGVSDLRTFRSRASSIRISSGRWQVCTAPSFAGVCAVISGSSDRLPTALDNRIVSIRPI